MPSELHRYWGQTSKLRNRRSCAPRLHILHHFIQVFSFRDRRGIFDIHFFVTRSFLCWGSSRCHHKQKCRTLKLWNRTVTQKQMSTWRQVQIQSSQMVYGWKRLSKQLCPLGDDKSKAQGTPTKSGFLPSKIFISCSMWSMRGSLISYKNKTA